MTVKMNDFGGAKSELQVVHRDLIYHLQICLPSKRAKISPSASDIMPSGTTLINTSAERDF